MAHVLLTRIQLVRSGKPALAQPPKMRFFAKRWDFKFEKQPDLVEAPELAAIGPDENLSPLPTEGLWRGNLQPQTVQYAAVEIDVT